MNLVTRAQEVGAVKSVILRMFGVQVTASSGQLLAEYMANDAGECTSVEKALRVSTFWACVRLLSQTVATLPLFLYKRKSDGSREVAYDEPLYGLLHDSPNADMTSVQFWELVVTCLLCWGNSYTEIKRAGGVIVSLDFLPPDKVVMRRRPNGERFYAVTDAKGSVRELAEGDVMHLAGFSLDGVTGLSPVQYARWVLGGAMAADEASRSVFVSGLMMRGTFTTPDGMVIKTDQREAFQQRIREYQGAMSNGKAPLLELGIRYAPITMNPDDAQMLQTRGFNVEEICRWLGVDPTMVGHGDKASNWGTGLEQKNIGFLTYSLRPWLNRIEQGIRKSLIPPEKRRKFYSEFAIEGLLRADSAGRAAYYSTMTQNGVMTRDECRGLENLSPHGGNAAVLTIQSNMLPIDKLGEGTPDAAAQDALKSWLGITESTSNAQQNSPAFP